MRRFPLAFSVERRCRRFRLIAALVLAGSVAAAGMPNAFAQPGPDASSPEQTAALTALNSGGNALKAGRFKEAVEGFTAAIDSGTLGAEGMALAYHHRGIAHQKLGLTGPAVADYTKAIWQEALPPRVLSRSHYNRGIAYAQMGEFERAERDYAAAIELNPTYASAYHNRGNLRRGEGDYAGAIADYDAALKHVDGEGMHLPLFGRALAKEAAGDIAGAIADLNEAVRVRPDFDLAADKLAELKSRDGTVTASITGAAPSSESQITAAGPSAQADRARDPAPAAAEETERSSTVTSRSREPVPATETASSSPSPAETEPRVAQSKNAATQEGGEPSKTQSLAASRWETTVTRFTPAASTAPGETAGSLRATELAEASTAKVPSEARPAEPTAKPEGTAGDATGSVKPTTPPAAARRVSATLKPASATVPADPQAQHRPFRVQIGSFRSIKEAEGAWNRLGTTHAVLLSSLQPYIAEADLGERGTYFRLQVGPFAAKGDARTLCTALKQREVDCLVVRP